jgi:hypothetical protein
MRTVPLALILLASTLFICCNDNPVTENNAPPPDPAKADQLATAGFQALGDSITALQDRDSEGLRNVRFDDIREQLESALDYESDNGIAHLGLAIVEILELNYSDEIWEVADSLDAWGGTVDDLIPPLSVAPPAGRDMLIGRQFELMATLPIAMSTRMAMTFPSNVSIARVQDIITNTVRPALTRSIGHLNIVEGRTGTEIRIHLDDNGVQEDVVIDLGEILLFSAAVHALRFGFSTATAYDVDLWGPDGTYDWLDDLRAYNGGCAQTWAWWVEVTDVGGGVVDLDLAGDVDLYPALVDSIWMDVARYNLEDRDEFLALRGGGSMLSSAHSDLLSMLDRLESAADFIRNRPHETEENVIKLADLTDLDSDLGDPGGPNFAKNWTRIEDVIDFARDLMTGPMTFTEELGPNEIPYAFTVDLSKLFSSPVGDWSDLLPYHRWNVPPGAWLAVDSVSTRETDWGGYDYFNYVRYGPGTCAWEYWPQVNHVSYKTTYWRFDPDSFFELLDGPAGSPIDLDVARFPYCPDYTFGGLFPGMIRADWVELIDILDPPPGARLAQARGVLR